MSMNLLQIDGKVAPGEKIAENKRATSTDSSPKSNRRFVVEKTKYAKEEHLANEERPRMDSAEVQAIAKEKSNSLRNSIVVAAMSPPPSGIRREDRSGIDVLLSQAAKKSTVSGEHAKTQVFDDDTPSVGSSRSRRSFVAQPVALSEAVVASAGSGITGIGQNGLSIMHKLSKQLNSCSSSDPMHELRVLTIRSEREMCRSRLEIAKAQVAKAEAEEVVLRAKKDCAKKEVEILNSLLDAYAAAEKELQSMGG
jgi:hypothetical protein